MQLSAKSVPVENILPWRDHYRQEMQCQIIHDSLHSRKGWTQSFLLGGNDITMGYGAIAVGGPWKGKPAAFEFYVAPPYRLRVFDLFDVFLVASSAVTIEVQSNDPFITAMLHAFARNVTSESILFREQVTTASAPPGAMVRQTRPEETALLKARELDESAKWIVECDGEVAGAGDILFHYNRPYGDIYMKVAEGFRRRGLGAYLVQELKRICYEGGNLPGARCNPGNIASRKTLQKAGFVPCGHILTGTVSR